MYSPADVTFEQLEGNICRRADAERAGEFMTDIQGRRAKAGRKPLVPELVDDILDQVAGNAAVNATPLDTLIHALMVKTGYDHWLNEHRGKSTLVPTYICIHLQVKALNPTFSEATAAARRSMMFGLISLDWLP
ncbi:hypothetical protein WJX74_004906 [Apatococcus lobatus]|uniref:Uncharacterized protein n=1 Tax=Apatococcus lobatus TaxID=904363 RepID=A0AAW1RZN7_9CHLO